MRSCYGTASLKAKPGGVWDVNELLELIQLTGLGDRYPSQLSGGQRQRGVAECGYDSQKLTPLYGRFAKRPYQKPTGRFFLRNLHRYGSTH
ncbi:hypothetical protein H6G89_15765 [Oscillatoria sp. FACHB-1407]|nr:hypothetical protein [Oscillatoria sp. FACHB-1407]MBD2462503.1 hypothetical protein [Oscillatoria sp. FACHB-1407]